MGDKAKGFFLNNGRITEVNLQKNRTRMRNVQSHFTPTRKKVRRRILPERLREKKKFENWGFCSGVLAGLSRREGDDFSKGQTFLDTRRSMQGPTTPCMALTIEKGYQETILRKKKKETVRPS